MGASGRRAALPECPFSVSPLEARTAQMQSRSSPRSRLARQYRVSIASWDNWTCPHASHTCIVVSPSTCADAGDETSNSVVMNSDLTSAAPPMKLLIS
jgi:hypothetical protein